MEHDLAKEGAGLKSMRKLLFEVFVSMYQHYAVSVSH